MQKVVEHLQAALALLDGAGEHAAAAQLDHLIHQVQASMATESDAS